MSRLTTELHALIKLGLPVALSQLAIIGMGTTDVLLAGRAGTDELAGLSLGNNVWNSIILFFFGIGAITQALVGKHFGAGDEQAIHRQIFQSLWMTFACGVVGTAAVLIGAELVFMVDFDEAMAARAYDYLYAIAWGALPMTMLPALRGSLEAMNQTRAVLWVNVVMFLVNIPLDYALIYGHWGFPKLGAVGCAWATALLLWLSLFAYAALLRWHSNLKHLRIFDDFQWPNRALIASTFNLGLPIGLSILIELSMFAGAGLLIALMGVVEAGAHSIAINIASASFMVYMGLGQGVTIRASQLLGAGREHDAQYSVKTGLVFNLLLALCMSLVFIRYRHELASLFSSDLLVVSLAAKLLLFGAVFQLADCLQVATISALRAYHETASPPRYQIVAFWFIGIPLGVGLGFYQWWPPLSGPQGFWFAMVLSLFVAGTLMLRRLWREMDSQPIPQKASY